MKRKLIYAIIFISIFLMSSASMVTPVQGYEPPDIPSEAKGMTLDDTEVTVYDEDEMDDHLGSGFSIKDIKAGDADIVGARSQMKILDWETDEDLIDYENDFSLGPSFAAANDDIRSLFQSMSLNYSSLGGVYGPYGPLAFIMNHSITNTTTWGSALQKVVASNVVTTANNAINQLLLSVQSWATAMTKWGESYDGTILEREVWDFLDPAEEFDPNDPDVDDDEVPYLLDPRDWRSSWDNLQGFTNELYGRLDAMQRWWGSLSPSAPGWYATLLGATATVGAGASWAVDPFEAYETINATIIEQIWAIPLTSTVSVALPGGNGALTTMPLAYFLDNQIGLAGPHNVSALGRFDLYSLPPGTGYGVYAHEDYVQGLFGFVDGVLETVRNTVKALAPDKVGYLITTLEAGQPCAGPAEDFIRKVIDEFNINEDLLWKIPFIQHGEDANLDGSVNELPVGTRSPNTGALLGGETIYIYAYVDISVDAAGTVEIEIEYQDGELDPRDVLRGKSLDDSKELEDWEWVFPKASDAPTQMKDGDTIFYETTAMAGPIPGYEIPVLIGVSLVSVIGLIYVIMRKRKQ